MGTRTGITWTDATWSPVSGCSKISAGCKFCYASRMVKRFPDVYPNGFDVHLRTEWLEKPLRWRKPRRVFVCSMSDLFHEDVPDRYIDKVFAVMAIASQHVYQCLTKRPERMRAYTEALYDGKRFVYDEAVKLQDGVFGGLSARHAIEAGFPNVWLGVSVENRRAADERIPLLVNTQTAVRWLSCEPLLGPLELKYWLHQISWCVVGGESGPGARPMDLDWARDLRDQCAKTGVPFFFKQVGGTRKVNGHWGGNELDGRIYEEWPR